MRRHPGLVTDKKIQDCDLDIRELIGELLELKDRDITTEDSMTVLAWLMRFFDPLEDGKFSPIRKDRIGAARFLGLKIGKIKSESIVKLCGALDGMTVRGSFDLYQTNTLYSFLNARMRMIHRATSKHRR